MASSSLWEVAVAYSKGGITLRGALADYLENLEKSFEILPITGVIAARAMLFSAGYPKDPTDRIIGATALVHKAKLVTADKRILASREVECVW